MPRWILSAFVVLVLLLPAVTISPAVPSRAAQEATPGNCTASTGFDADGVTVTLESTFASRDVVSFGLPVPPATLQDANMLGVSLNGAAIDATVKVLLGGSDASGSPADIRSVLVQFPSSALSGSCNEVRVSWSGGGVAVSETTTPFSETSAESSETVEQAVYGLEEQNGVPTLTITRSGRARTLHVARAGGDGGLPARIPGRDRALR